MSMQNAWYAGLAVSAVIMLAAVPAFAAPTVLNPNFTINDQASNNSFNNGALFYIQNWKPSGFASNSNTDSRQYDNGSAGGRTVVGYLSGASTSFSQVVNGFVVGRTYEISVGANTRASIPNNPIFRILANNVQVYAPTTLHPVGPVGSFTTAFTPIQSDSFIATNTFVTITFANASTSNANASTLLTNASVFQVPEPISLAILGSGLVSIGLVRRRCR